MTVSTHGIVLKSGSRAWRAGVELLSSMRFSISLLTVICIASVIGTVLKQHEPLNNYVNQFGPFWADVFAAVSLYNVYSAWWFLLILAFLVLSTSLCIARNAPKIWVDLRAYKENMREQSLKAFGQRAEAQFDDEPEVAARRLGDMLVKGGWKVKLQRRELVGGGVGWMLAAKTGAANKLGYIAAHSAIVLVCLGGLLDGDLIVRAQMLFNGKSVYQGGGLVADVPPQHRLSERNPTFRGNLLVTEGTQSSTAILSQSDGVLLQELPFSVELKKFIVEYYSTGMPKLFASDIVIHDKATGAQTPARVEVNHPASYGGVEIYQSSFDDGGSKLHLRAMSLDGRTQPFDLEGTVGGASELTSQAAGGAPLTVEYTGLRVINVENFAGPTDAGVDVRKVDLRSAVTAQMGAPNKTRDHKTLRNVGPSVTYKLRDGSGQAREYNNYMLPVDMGDGVPVFLLGMRENPADTFRYIRVPADEQGNMDDFVRLNGALHTPALRDLAVQRYARNAAQGQRPELIQQIGASASRALALFAGADSQGAAGVAGLQAISDFIEANVPQVERNRAGEVLIRILNGTLYELAQVARERAKLPPLGTDARVQAFMTQAVLALSDVPLYPAPVVLTLADFTQVQASVFQVARAPGKKVVYLGCALLIFGVFSMLYVRERRLWLWLSPVTGDRGAHATLAFSTNRKTMDSDKEFAHLKARLLGHKDLNL